MNHEAQFTIKLTINNNKLTIKVAGIENVGAGVMSVSHNVTSTKKTKMVFLNVRIFIFGKQTNKTMNQIFVYCL